MPGQSTSVMMSAGSAFIKAIGLMFYQPNKETTIAGLASRFMLFQESIEFAM